MALEILRKKLEVFPEKEGFARVVIRPVRGKDKSIERWRVMAIFPESTVLTHHGLDKNATGTSDGNQAIYYEPIAACYKNACYDYLTNGLLAGAGGETKRIRISDLWKRTGVKF